MTQTSLFGTGERSDGRSLAEARRELIGKLDAGSSCPCCGQWAKRYARKLNSGMARSLITAYRHARKIGFGLFFQFDEAGLEQNDEYAKLAYWGLMERGVERGQWRVTTNGRLFVEEKITVPRKVLVYNDEQMGYATSEQTTIRRALGDHFNYDELMGRP